jgi:O-antigen/teichoic acid export membrane protein
MDLWTGNVVLANEVAPILALLAVGTLLNGLMNIPYMLQLAHGWSGFAAWVNLVAVVILVPAILWVTPRYGALGAAWVWVALNAGYVMIAIHFMYRRLLPEEKWAWYWSDTARPLVTATLAAWVLSELKPEGLGRFAEFSWLIAAGMFVAGAAIVATPKLLTSIIDIYRKS